jgi:hypothetical protein
MNRRDVLIGGGVLGGLACRRQSPEMKWPFVGVPAERLATPAKHYEGVSLVELLCQREKWDGKAIRVVGFGHLEFEGQALYLHQEDCEWRTSMNSVALDVPSSDPAFLRWNDRYVVVEGIFKAWARGPGAASLRAGMIGQVSRYDPRPTAEELRRESERLEREAPKGRRTRG